MVDVAVFDGLDVTVLLSLLLHNTGSFVSFVEGFGRQTTRRAGCYSLVPYSGKTRLPEPRTHLSMELLKKRN